MKDGFKATVTSRSEDDDLIQRSLESATDTKVIELGSGVLQQVVDVFERCFGDVPAVVVADRNTMDAAGRRVCDLFRDCGHTVLDPVIIPGNEPSAKYTLVTELRDALEREESVAIAVGAGTVNDLTKLSSHQLGRKYMVVGTAASMDGYTAFGASITRDGYKITIACPAPTALVADTEIFADAPEGMNAAGYADLLAKVPAGADWILADSVGLDPINPVAWSLVQDRLRKWIGDPEGIRSGKAEAAESLMIGLVMAGLAMQTAVSSRPASGAEHQFSHLWDMQGHQHEGRSPFHGYKVGIGSLTSASMYEFCLETDLSTIDVEVVCRNWPDPEMQTRRIRDLHEANNIAPSVWSEVASKFVPADVLRDRLNHFREDWAGLSLRLQQQLMSARDLQEMLRQAGAPAEPEMIGISRERLRAGLDLAHSIRNRYTIHDLLYESNLREPAEEAIFGPDGIWAGRPG